MTTKPTDNQDGLVFVALTDEQVKHGVWPCYRCDNQFHGQDCLEYPCTPAERTDGKRGYYVKRKEGSEVK